MIETSIPSPLLNFLRVQRAALLLALGAFVGCSVYFSLPFEPTHVTWGCLLLTLCALAAWRRQTLFFAGAFLLFFGWSQISTMRAVQHYIPIEEGRYWVTGRIINMMPSEKRIAIVLRDVTVYQSDAQLDSVRISVASSRWPDDLGIGHGVATEAYLSPPKKPLFSGDYDGRLASLFHKPQAFGYVMGSFDATYIPHKIKGLRRAFADFRYFVESVRFSIAERMAPRSHGLLSALLVGERGYLSGETWQAFRDSGLAHLLAISGMHLGFFAGGIFFFLRWFVAFSASYLALNYPIKRIAAGVALVSAGVYMLLAGSTIPTVRAFILLAALFGAIMLNRQRLILRAMALAVMLILFIWPESAVTASFQLSFAAAGALAIYFYGYEARERQRFRLQRRARYLPLVLLSSFVAGLVTLPLSILHFGMASLSGILVNLLAIPLTAFAIMPSAILVFLTLPFGMSLPFEWGMTQATNVLYGIAVWGSAWPLNGMILPEWSGYLLALPALYTLYALYQEQFKRAFVSFMLMLGLLVLLPNVATRPDIYSLADGSILLKRVDNKTYQQLAPPSDEKLSYDHKRLLSRFLEQKRITLREESGQAKSCDATGCVFTVKKKTFLLPTHLTTAEDCRLADIILTSKPLEISCAAWMPDLKGMQALDLIKQKQRIFKTRNSRLWH